jgi:hypothetical protein
MTISTFNQLPLTMKAHLVLHNGNHLVKMDLGEKCEAHLYKLPNFYAEVTRYKLGDRITNILAFESEKKLAPFIEDIDLQDLL